MGHKKLKTKNCLAFDLGASNGRAILGEFDGSKIVLRELNRFMNDPVHIRGEIYWDILKLYNECYKTLTGYSVVGNGELVSVGFDSWGSDYSLFCKNGKLISNPYHYRDRRTDGILEITNAIMPHEEIEKMTGNACEAYNTLHQLAAHKIHDPEQLDAAETMLMIPDLMAFFFTGEKSGEFTNITTSQLMDIDRKSWCDVLINKMGLPKKIFPKIVQPGSIKGSFTKEPGLSHLINTPVVATATHDTASAIAAIPGLDPDSVFISSGTWSLIGVETDAPVVNDHVFKYGYTNEGSADGKNLLLRNTVGMWIFQQCMKDWNEKGDKITYEEVLSKVEKAVAFLSFINTDDKFFALPGDMPNRVNEYIENSGQTKLDSPEQMTRSIMESLALRIRYCVENLQMIQNRKFNKIHVVGGGSKNKILNQFTADALGIPVCAGPDEATSTGNILVQLIASGDITDLTELRQIVSNSFTQSYYEPKDKQKWDDAYMKYTKIINTDLLK